MANNYQILSEDAIKYLCGLIRDLASVSEGIDNINLADDKTFSNIYIKNLIDKCLEDANAEAEKLVGALTHLTCEETAIQPTLDNSEINVIYLYSADGNSPYQQFLKISEDKLVDLGSTSISLEDYIKAADVAKDYATKVELKAVTDKIGTTALTTTDTTITGAIEEVKRIVEGKADKSDISTAYDDTEVKESIEELSSNLGEKVDYKVVVEDGSRYVEDVVTQDINTWLPNDNSSILINLKKTNGINYLNFQLLCNKKDSKNWSCIVNGAANELWKIRYINGVRYIDELDTKLNFTHLGTTTVAGLGNYQTLDILVDWREIYVEATMSQYTFTTIIPKVSINRLILFGCSLGYAQARVSNNEIYVYTGKYNNNTTSTTYNVWYR